MAVIAREVMSYEAYLKEGETNWRYDIIDGVRVDMPSPNARHQRIAQKITRLLEDYEVRGLGLTLAAPCDVQITLFPLRTRQPDVLFITLERWGNRPLDAPPPIDAVPELVVEVVSDSDRQRVLNAKIADFCTIGVNECWIVRPEERNVTLVCLTPEGTETFATFGEDEEITSLALPDLTLAISDIFNIR